jgi:galactitol-specific phosphotransferase system IIB component
MRKTIIAFVCGFLMAGVFAIAAQQDITSQSTMSDALDAIDDNFDELYGLVSGATDFTLLDVDNIRLNGNKISTTDANGDLELEPNGTGDVIIDGTDWSVAADGDASIVDLTLAGQLILSSESVTCGDGTNTCTVSASVICHFLTSDNDADGADVVTVADGTAGEVQIFYMATDGGDDIEVTPTNFIHGTKITLDAAGDIILLFFDGTNWAVISGYGASVT